MRSTSGSFLEVSPFNGTGALPFVWTYSSYISILLKPIQDLDLATEHISAQASISVLKASRTGFDDCRLHPRCELQLPRSEHTENSYDVFALSTAVVVPGPMNLERIYYSQLLCTPANISGLSRRTLLRAAAQLPLSSRSLATVPCTRGPI
ncbi:hypothetical protein HYPSUDRAFT_207825 [Hypholoma sublateritium FD-334 SS-4]|uniref:Uncharacterized protein n=1 Tax=Hypholoma sublateritium (strain FD-334 SS-4) TaxID=945553 RepID=A0A0D2P4V2_HYPSF|nr:hypothetical protein HYPSUDRAFT_207825 [Hypholoma sublateritium FD-334 SS-4]